MLRGFCSAPEKDVVPLVVEGDHPPALESRVLAEQGCKHAANPLTQPGAKVVQDELRLVSTGPPMALHVMSSRHSTNC